MIGTEALKNRYLVFFLNWNSHQIKNNINNLPKISIKKPCYIFQVSLLSGKIIRLIISRAAYTINLIKLSSSSVNIISVGI